MKTLKNFGTGTGLFLSLTGILLLFNSNAVFSQVQFQKVYGTGSNELIFSGQKTSDGGYIMAGNYNYSTITYSAGILVKLDANGDTLWTKWYDTPAYDWFTSVKETSDGSLIMVGPTGFVFGSTDIYAIKTGASGNIIWSKTIGGSLNDDPFNVFETVDGHYLVNAFTGSFGSGVGDPYIVKINSATGDTMWTSVIASPFSQTLKGGFQRSTGEYVFVGQTYDQATFDTDILIVYTNQGGTIAGAETYGGPGSENTFDLAEVVLPTNDGGFILGGRSNNWGANDIILVKFDSLNVIQWAKNYGGPINEYIFDIKQTSDGGYIFAGSSSSISPNITMSYAVRTDANGDTLWTRSYHGSSETEFYSVDLTADGGFVFMGYSEIGSQSDLFVVKTDANGNSGCNEFATQTTVTGITLTGGNIGATVEHGGMIQNNIDVIGSGLTTLNTHCFASGINENVNSGLHTIYPNPTSGIINIEFNSLRAEKNQLQFFDLSGRMICKIDFDAVPGINKLSIPSEHFSGGIYTIKFSTGENSIAQKFVVVK